MQQYFKLNNMDKIKIENNENETSIKWYHAKTSNVVALLILIGFFLFGTALFIWEVPQNNQQLMTYIVGLMGTAVGGAIYYLFQYRNSDQKDNK